MPVEVFKTNVNQLEDTHTIIHKLRTHFPKAKINFDLEDCDKILRIENDSIDINTIIEVLHQNGYQSEVLM